MSRVLCFKKFKDPILIAFFSETRSFTSTYYNCLFEFFLYIQVVAIPYARKAEINVNTQDRLKKKDFLHKYDSKDRGGNNMNNLIAKLGRLKVFDHIVGLTHCLYIISESKHK